MLKTHHLSMRFISILAFFHESDVPEILLSCLHKMPFHALYSPPPSSSVLEFCPWKRWWRGNHHAAELCQNCRGGESCVRSFVALFVCIYVRVYERSEEPLHSQWLVLYHVTKDAAPVLLFTAAVKMTSMKRPEHYRPSKTRTGAKRGRWIWCHRTDAWRDRASGGWMDGWMDEVRWRGVLAQVYRHNRWAFHCQPWESTSLHSQHSKTDTSTLMLRGHRLIVCLTFASLFTEENSFHREN